MTDDCIWEITRGAEPHGTLYSGSSEVRTAIDDAFKAVPNIHYEPLRCHYGKDHVVVELLVTGTRVDGEELRFHACDIVTLAEDKNRRQVVIPEGARIATVHSRSTSWEFSPRR